MQVDRKKLIKSLKDKGFVPIESDHLYLHHEYNGKPTGAYAKVSRGSGFKTYGDSLLKMLRIQLKLDKMREAYELCSCPMTAEEYEDILRRKRVI